jgi:Fic family protein
MSNLVEATQAAIEKEELHPIEIAAQFHRHFIFLHPFRDGNGRLGRLLSNFILAKFQNPLIIIEKEDKPDYLNALRACRDQRNTAPMVKYFFSAAIKRMEKEIAQKKNNEMEMDF